MTLTESRKLGMRLRNIAGFNRGDTIEDFRLRCNITGYVVRSETLVDLIIFILILDGKWQLKLCYFIVIMDAFEHYVCVWLGRHSC